jgi:hypothetical protein
MTIFTDPWNGKHEATIQDINPENQHATLRIDTTALNVPDEEHIKQWFGERSGTFKNVPHHTEGAPYSYTEQ